jgi:hypothetical protein
MSGPCEKDYHCPQCGSRIDPRRLGGATNFWDVLRLVVIFAGLIGIIAAWKRW